MVLHAPKHKPEPNFKAKFLPVTQVWLVATGQTTWEHAQRGRVVYLHHLPDSARPFDAGLAANCAAFLHGDWSARGSCSAGELENP